MGRFIEITGDWRGLDSKEQAPRYATIAELLHNFQANMKVLDVGCGEALLSSWLPLEADYTGIELSSAAVRKAKERYPSLRIIHTSAECFAAHGELFCSIVFNEMLYYTADPVGLLKKYSELLCPQGFILCSIYQKPNRISKRHILLHSLSHRRHIPHIQCTKLVRAFMAREKWPILDDRMVVIPGTADKWNIWIARPLRVNPE